MTVGSRLECRKSRKLYLLPEFLQLQLPASFLAGTQEANTAMLWGCGPLPRDEDAVLTGVSMSVDEHVTGMKEPNNKNSIKQEDKQLLLKLLFKFVFPFYFTQFL